MGTNDAREEDILSPDNDKKRKPLTKKGVSEKKKKDLNKQGSTVIQIKNEDCEDIKHPRLIFGDSKKDKRFARSQSNVSAAVIRNKRSYTNLSYSRLNRDLPQDARVLQPKVRR